MKKCIVILLCVCVLSVTAFASDSEPDYIAEYESQYGKAPVATDYSSDTEYQAAYDAWFSGLVPYINRRTAEDSEKKAAEEKAARIAAEKEAAEKTAEEQTSVTPPKSIESAGSTHETNTIVPVSPGSVDKYPVGSYVDPAGNVFSASGALLSSGTTPATASALGLDKDVSLLSDELGDPNDVPASTDPDTLSVIAGLVSDIATDQPAWYVNDLRSADAPIEVLTGLKSLVTSIFGEYTPITTTSVISETVGNDTHQYLVETVAPGAAGVDYEWVASVVLFAIMLYCLMKLLGGVLK